MFTFNIFKMLLTNINVCLRVVNIEIIINNICVNLNSWVAIKFEEAIINS